MTPWTILNPTTGAVFALDEAGGSDTGKFSRGDLLGVYNLDQRQIISSVIAHNPGERRTNSRDVPKAIRFSGFVWGNPSKDEPGLRANIDTLHAAFTAGTVHLCVDGDGRYWACELRQFDDGIKDGDVWHTEYTATFYSESPYSYGAAPFAATVLTSTALSAVSGTLYAYSWTAGNSTQLGSAPSPLVVTVTLVTAHGCFWLALTNTSTTPATTCAIIAPPGLGPFTDADIILFDAENGQATLTRAGVTVKSPIPVVPIVLDRNVATPTGLTLSARAAAAPVVTIRSAFSARFR